VSETESEVKEGVENVENNEERNVDLQEKLGVDAVIVDHVAHVSKYLLRKSVALRS